MFRVRDDAWIYRAARVRTELTESDDAPPLECCPDRRRRGIDAAVLPVFIRARRLEGTHEFRRGIGNEPHSIRSHRVKAFCRQPTLKRRADDLARRVAQRANCENG